MKSETKICQSCHNEFTIEPEDFIFYEKVRVPPPTWCPLCSMQRRMIWRNERSLYKRKDAFGKDVISIFAPEKPFVVYDQKKWWSDSWDALEYGREYDFSKPFFQQFRELLEQVPAIALFNKNAINSDYCNHSEDSRNCYLAHASIWNEGVFYSKGAIKCKDSMDILFVDKSELVYEGINCEQCFRVAFSQHSTSCNNSFFLYDCHGCSNCFGCINLRNKSHYIFNKPYSKEEYEKKIKEFDMGKYGVLQEIREKLRSFHLSQPHRFAHLVNSPGSTGEGLYDCRSCKWCFDVTDNVENCKYVSNAGYNLKDSYHGYGVGMGQLLYEVIDTGIGGSKIFATVVERNGTEVRYAFNCHNSSFIFGCVGLRNKNYCVLNKQYSKEEYEKLVSKIVAQMSDLPYIDKQGRKYSYGEFFPAEISPFAYNETVAQEYFPLTKEEAIEKGFSWKEDTEKGHMVSFASDRIPYDVKDADDALLNEIIGCLHEGKCKEQCTAAFKITPQELDFYRKMNFALPRLCPNCRHYRRLSERAAMRLWKRKCMCVGGHDNKKIYANKTLHFHGSDSCISEFETPYSPERSEIVYCEDCYQNEVM